MQATIRNIVIEGGSGASGDVVFVWEITVNDQDNTPLSTLDGATTTFNIKRSYSDATALVSLDEDDGITIDHVTSKITINLTVAHLTNIDLSVAEVDLLYDWDLIDNTGRHYRLYRGQVTIVGDL